MSDFTAVQLLNQLTPVIITGGYVPRGAYAAGTDYAVGDSVDYLGSSYVMYVDAAAGTAPTDTTKWQVLANKGDTGSTGATGSTGSTGATGASITSAAFSSNDIVFTKDDTNTVTLTDAAITLKGATGATGGTGTLEDLGGATKALDNLASVAINTSLISDTDSTDDLGSTTKQWANVHTDRLVSTIADLVIENDLSDGDITFKVNDGGVDKTVMTLDGATGNVGIGTTSPSYSLDVAGGMRGNYLLLNNSGGASSPSIQLGGDADTGIFGSANTVAFTNNGTEAMRISGGKVGIGTMSPGAKLDVNSGIGDNTVGLKVVGSPATGTFTDDYGLVRTKAAAAIGTGFGTTGGAALNVYTYTKDAALFVNGDGNVGIGTTGPTSKLQIVGTDGAWSSSFKGNLNIVGAADNSLSVGSYGTSPYAVWLQSGDNRNGGTTTYPLVLNPIGGNVGIGTTSPGGTAANGFTLGANSRVLELNSAAISTGYPSLYLRNSNRSVGLDITVDPVTTGTVFLDSRYPTVSPTTPGGFRFRVATDSTAVDALSINNSGNVGIGTTSPEASLQISKTLSNAPYKALILQNNDSGVRLASTIYMDFANDNTAVPRARILSGGETDWSGYDGYLSFLTDDDGTLGERVRITSTGNVGIGTTAPTNILSLGGNSARTFWLERHTTANTAGNTLTVTAGGATSGATDKAGGDLILTPGLSTGTGESGVQIKGVPAGSTGTTDGTQTLMIQVLGNKFGVFANTPVVKQTGIAALKVDYTAGDLDTEAEIITAINTTNTAINALRTALNNYGFTTVV